MTPRERPKWSGFYYDGRSASREPVEIGLGHAGLEVRRPDGTVLVWPYAALRQTQGTHEGEQLRIEYGRELPEAITVAESGLAEAIRLLAPDASRSLRERARSARVVAWSLGGIATFALLYFTTAPLAAEWAASRVPPQWEAELGRGVASRVSSTAHICEDPAITGPVQSMLDRLLAAQPKSPYEYRMVVLRDSSVNAFAAPGGFIAVHSGLLAAAESPDEIAGVLAHEIVHVERRHSTRMILREVPLRMAIAALSGGSGFDAATGFAGTLGMLRYRRGDEAEADREGVRLLRAAGVDGAAAVSFMRKLEAERASESRFANYLSSHPRTVDRIAELEALTRAERYETRPLLDGATWAVVRRGCAAGED